MIGILFNSYIFILFFLPFTLAGYFIFNKFNQYRAADIWLIVMSLIFYGYNHPAYLIVITLSVVINYLLSRMILAGEGSIRKQLTALGIMLNAAVIFYFKYYDFFIENIDEVFGRNFPVHHILLPLGISFFTFQQISYIVDSYRGETADYGFIEYALFVTFFPQLVAGPIVLHGEIIPQLRDRKRRVFSQEKLAAGIYFFTIGLFKKVILADTLGSAVTWGFESVWDVTAAEMWLVSLSYTFQIYFDFSGYCDMAIGIARMFGIDLPENFNSPYKAESVIDFWNRWHMSLTGFLRKYIYFPLGGSRRGTVRTYVNILIVFLVSGIWHGASWTFIIWGLMHGVLQCINRFVKPVWDKVIAPVKWLVTFTIINATWIMFRADNVFQGFKYMGRLFNFNKECFSIRPEIYEGFKLVEFDFVVSRIKPLLTLYDKVPGLYMYILIGISFIIVLSGNNTAHRRFKPDIASAAYTVILLVWSIMSLSGISQFLYFNF